MYGLGGIEYGSGTTVAGALAPAAGEGAAAARGAAVSLPPG